MVEKRIVLNAISEWVCLQLTPLQRANAHLNVAKGLYYAYLMLLRTQGLTSKTHPYHQEMVSIPPATITGSQGHLFEMKIEGHCSFSSKSRRLDSALQSDARLI